MPIKSFPAGFALKCLVKLVHLCDKYGADTGAFAPAVKDRKAEKEEEATSLLRIALRTAAVAMANLAAPLSGPCLVGEWGTRG